MWKWMRIYVYVCVCVCVTERTTAGVPMWVGACESEESQLACLV